MTAPLPDWLVERAALDEVPATSAGRVAEADAGALAARVAALREANAAELAAHPVDQAVAQIQARVAKKPPARSRAWLGGAGLALAAAAGVAIYVGTRPPDVSPEGVPPVAETEHVKGATHLAIYRQTGGERAELLHADDVAQEGDTLQIRYDAGKARHGVIASVDGAGTVTLHFPASEDAPTKLEARPTALPQAYALDDAPRFERFFFITSTKAPIDVGATLGILRDFAHQPDAADAEPALPADLHSWSLRVRKGSK